MSLVGKEVLTVASEQGASVVGPEAAKLGEEEPLRDKSGGWMHEYVCKESPTGCQYNLTVESPSKGFKKTRWTNDAMRKKYGAGGKKRAFVVCGGSFEKAQILVGRTAAG